MSTIPVYVFAKWQVKDGQQEKVLNLLAEVAKETRKEAGNLFYKIHQSNSDKNTLIIFEGYKDQSAQEMHRDSIHFQTIVITQIVPLLEKREVITASEILLTTTKESF